MDLSECIDCQPSVSALVTAFVLGALLVAAALRLRPRHPALAKVVLVVGLAWNGLLAFTFIYPHNHHAIYLGDHRTSLLANAAVGVVWVVGIGVTLAFGWRKAPSVV